MAFLVERIETPGCLNSLTFLEKCSLSEENDCLFADVSRPETKRTLPNKKKAKGNKGLCNDLVHFCCLPQRMMGMESVPMLNGTAGAHGGEDYQHWMDSQAAQGKSASTQVHRHSGEVYSNTLPVRKVAPTKSKSTLGKHL